LKSRGLEKKPEYKERLREELDIIKAKNFSTYFLIVADMVQWAKGRASWSDRAVVRCWLASQLFATDYRR
jgi:hypothetical protein